MEAVYAELHAIAARHMRRERPGHILQATALVNAGNANWQDRSHFFAAANLMRRFLVDHARKTSSRWTALYNSTWREILAPSG
jgi:hypothetical protein